MKVIENTSGRYYRYNLVYCRPFVTRFLFIIPCFLFIVSCDSVGDKEELQVNIDEEQSSAITYKPVPLISVAGEPLKAETLVERADELSVPSAALAIFKDGKLVHEAFKGDDIGSESLFQAASLSKAVASATIVTLALREGISLDEDLSPYITSFDLSSLEGYSAPVTLRELLSHTSGATVGGFPGYPSSAQMPTNTEVILGSSRSITPRVAFTRPEGQWYYSGGGYQIAQAFAEDVSGTPFAEVAKELVFDPIGMTHSSFMQPLDREAIKPLVAVPAYTRQGDLLEGSWHNYPELATAGLWTTAEDYGKFVVALMNASTGDEHSGVNSVVAREMLTAAGQRNAIQRYGLGLGIILDDNGKVQTFEHHGANEGYRSSFTAFPEVSVVSVVLTNHPGGLQLAQDINRGVGLSFGYVDSFAKTVTREPLTSELRTRCVGNYVSDEEPGEVVSLVARDEIVIFKDGDGDYPLVHLGEGAFLYVPLDLSLNCSMTDGQSVLTIGSSSRYIKLTP